MNHFLDDVVLRRPETKDLEALYRQKNDPEVAEQLGGFSRGYSRADIVDWLERHRRASDEVLWAIADAQDDACLGHAGLYRIDHRVRSAEFAIMIGERAAQGRGLGKKITQFALRYGFEDLNLHRIELSFLSSNDRARRLYEGVGFKEEGVLRAAQYKAGRYLDVVLMSILRNEFNARPA
jgi:RimJ/RimL family protein N-acetyltransferase